MKTRVMIFASTLGLTLTASAGQPLPPGMARADDRKAVAALHSESNQKRVAAIERQASGEERLTAAEEYQLKLIAYRTQLVEEQRQRKVKELELQIEREARLLAEERAAELRRERRREAIYIQHQSSLHAYQRNLNDEYWREQRLRKIIREEQQQPCPPTPCPSPAPDEETSGDVLP